jgi:hypothetical protein
MADLTPEAQALVSAGRAALRPVEADRERVLQALLPKLGGAGGATTMLARAPSAAKAMLMKSGAVLVGLGAAGAGLFYALRPEAPSVSSPPAAQPAPLPPALPAPPSADTEGSTPVAPEAKAAEKRTSSAPRSPDSLAQEVAILSRAGAELHAGQPQAALAALSEHQRKFPNGVLSQERTAARVQALCALGRMKEARSELSRLTRVAPNSPLEARARKACGSAITEKN